MLLREVNNFLESSRNRKGVQEKATAFIKFTGAFHRMEIAVITYANYMQNADCSAKQRHEIQKQFDFEKSETIKFMNFLEKMGVVIPKDLKQTILKIKVDELKDGMSCETFLDMMEEKQQRIILNYE